MQLSALSDSNLQRLNRKLVRLFADYQQRISQRALFILTDKEMAYIELKFPKLCKIIGCNKKMSMYNFILRFSEIIDKQLNGYPNNMINSVKLCCKRLNISENINIAEFVDNELGLDKTMLSKHDDLFVFGKIGRYNKKINTKKSWNRCYGLSGRIGLIAGILGSTMMMLYDKLLDVPTLRVLAFIAKTISGFCIAMFFLSAIVGCYYNRVVCRMLRNDNLTQDPLLEDSYCRFRELVLRLVVIQTILNSCENSAELAGVLNNFFPSDICGEIISYVIGEVKSEIKDFFSEPQQKVLRNYFDNKVHGAVGFTTESSVKHDGRGYYQVLQFI